MCDQCKGLGIPDRLYRNGRPEENTFKEDELIYRRFFTELPEEEWRKNDSVTRSIFPVKGNDSCNRHEYSQGPEDVLFNIYGGDHFHHWGVLAFSVSSFRALGDLPLVNNGVTRLFSFELRHVPEDCMYPHSEIWVMEDGKKLWKIKEGERPESIPPPKSIKAAIRQRLLRISELVIEPNLRHRPPTE